jgi:hypothetical protein
LISLNQLPRYGIDIIRDIGRVIGLVGLTGDMSMVVGEEMAGEEEDGVVVMDEDILVEDVEILAVEIVVPVVIQIRYGMMDRLRRLTAPISRRSIVVLQTSIAMSKERMMLTTLAGV